MRIGTENMHFQTFDTLIHPIVYVTVPSSFKLGNLTAMMESDTSSTDHSELLELEENVPNIVLGDNTKQIFTELLELKKYEDGYQVSK